MILPDTNILIAYLKEQEPSLTLIKQAIRKQELLLSVIVVAETLIKATNKDTRVIDSLVDNFDVLPINREIMMQAVKYRKETMRKSKRVHLLDCFVAATAKVHHAMLVTYDTHDYPFPDLAIRKPEALVL